MFNDDIDSVRINAVHSLSKLGSKVKLSEDQVSVPLSLSKQIAPCNSLHNGRHKSDCENRHPSNACQCTNVKCHLLACFYSGMLYFYLMFSKKALISSLVNMFPEDQDSIFCCLKELAITHATYVGTVFSRGNCKIAKVSLFKIF